MIVLTKGQTAEYLYVTLNEKRTLSNGYYVFLFENVTTKAQYTKVYSFAEDESDYSSRYNKFPLNTSSVFSSAQSGEYIYKVYESATNTTNVTGLTEVECGIMVLNPATEFTYDSYSTATTFKQYAG